MYMGVSLCEVDDAEHADRHTPVGIVESKRLCQDKAICVDIFQDGTFLGNHNVSLGIVLDILYNLGNLLGLGLD